MARNTLAHEIKRRWKVTFESPSHYGETVEVVSPDIEGVREYIRAYPARKFNYAEEITTPAELAAELERIKPFIAQRAADQIERDALCVEKESHARTDAYYAKVAMFRWFIGLGVIACGGWLGSLFL